MEQGLAVAGAVDAAEIGVALDGIDHVVGGIAREDRCPLVNTADEDRSIEDIGGDIVIRTGRLADVLRALGLRPNEIAAAASDDGELVVQLHVPLGEEAALSDLGILIA